MLPKPGRDDRVAVRYELPRLDLGETCANVFGERAIDGHAGHAVGRMAEPSEIRLGLAHATEARRAAGLHVDADDFPRVVLHRVPEAAVAMLHTSLLDVLQETSRGRLPVISLFGHDARGMMLAKGPVGEFEVTQGATDLLQSLLSLSRPVGAAILEDELVD